MNSKCRMALGAAAVLATAGCYTYRPIAPDALAVQAEVRARLTPEQVEELRSVMPNGERIIEGRVLERGGDSVLLLVPVVSELRGARVETMHQRLNIPHSGFIEVELRELDRFRTGVAIAAGGLVVGTILVRAIRHAINPGSGNGGPPETDFVGGRIVVPIRR